VDLFLAVVPRHARVADTGGGHWEKHRSPVVVGGPVLVVSHVERTMAPAPTDVVGTAARDAEDATPVRKISVYCTCWWYSLCNFQYRSSYENTCSDHFVC
jgi:hypothetical protein